MAKIKQGEILLVEFDGKGHEQKEYRPAIVISNKTYHKIKNLVIVCPITRANRDFPLYVPLDETSKIEGVIMCDHIKSIDLKARRHKRLGDKASKEVLKKVIEIVTSQIDILDN